MALYTGMAAAMLLAGAAVGGALWAEFERRGAATPERAAVARAAASIATDRNPPARPAMDERDRRARERCRRDLERARQRAKRAGTWHRPRAPRSCRRLRG